MTIKFLNATDYANIYGLIDENGKAIATKTVTLAGRYAGTTFQSWGKYGKREIRKMFKEVENNK